jgi:hypothetical protein
MIRPVEVQGVIQRNQDMATVNQNENDRPFVQQENAMNVTKKEIEVKIRDVNQKEDTQNPGNHADAKEKGSNEYEGDGGKHRRHFTNTEGTVKIKERKNFDVKV